MDFEDVILAIVLSWIVISFILSEIVSRIVEIPQNQRTMFFLVWTSFPVWFPVSLVIAIVQVIFRRGSFRKWIDNVENVFFESEGKERRP